MKINLQQNIYYNLQKKSFVLNTSVQKLQLINKKKYNLDKNKSINYINKNSYLLFF